ncbi:hypothetical protein GGR54DRAFT_642283 [Hypoxylon sp. NC1633]|nr:hypothetical protein GGR54DRAFT_642283 [Hypoxylon sp. NC1633]
MIHQTDMLAPEAARLYYTTPEYQRELAEVVAETRTKLDTDDIGQKLMAHWRTKENEIQCCHHRRVADARRSPNLRVGHAASS